MTQARDVQDYIINTENWPIIYIEISETPSEGAEQPYLAEMQAILDRREPYAVILTSPDKIKSPKFNAEYMKWYKKTKDVQRELCAGVIRVEPAQEKRSIMKDMAQKYLAKAVVVYPFEICSSYEAAEAKAKELLAKKV